MNRIFALPRWRALAAIVLTGIPYLFLWGGLSLGLVKGGSVAVVGLGGALLAFLAYGVQNGGLAFWPELGWVCAFLFMAALSCGVAPNTMLAWHQWEKIASILLPLSLLFHRGLFSSLKKAAPHVAFYLPFALLFGFFLLAVFYGQLYHAPVFDAWALAKHNRGLTYGLVFLWPVLAVLFTDPSYKRLKWYLFGGLLFLVLPCLILTHSRAGQIGFVIAVALFPLSYFYPRFLAWGLRLGIGGSVLWPFAARLLWNRAFPFVERLPDSWRARVEIWDYLSYRIEARPLTGWGLGAVPSLSPAQPHGDLYLYTQIPPAHAHNYITSFWVDFGLWGALAGLLLTLGLLQKAMQMPRALQPYVLSAFLVGWGMALVAYDFWTDSLLATYVLCGFWFAWLASTPVCKKEAVQNN